MCCLRSFSLLYYLSMENYDSYIQDGWRLSEFTDWISNKEKDQFFQMLGNDNIIVISQLESKPHKKWKAKLLISPQGIQILNLYFLPVAGNA